MADDKGTSDGSTDGNAAIDAAADTAGTSSTPDSTTDAADLRRLESERKAADRAKLLEDYPTALSASDILDAGDLPSEWVPVPQWKGRVLVRGLTGKERDWFEGQIVRVRGKVRETNTDNIRAKLCQLSIVDPADTNPDLSKRRPMFTPKQIEVLGKKSAAALDAVYEVAARLSALSAADVEELAGNSEAGSGGSSSS